MRIAIAGGTGLIGSQLVAQAHAAGYQTVVLARSEGLDITDAQPLRAALYGVDALVDVTQSPSLNETVAREFFTLTAANLAEASGSVGVGRTVVLSQVGCDRASGVDSDPDPDSLDGYLRAKASHEQASRGTGHGETHVVRSTQTHNFVGQLLSRSTHDDVARIPGVAVQPVEVSFLVDVLLDVATGARHEPMLEVAGPQVEQMDDLAQEFLDYYFEQVRIQVTTPSECLLNGALLAGNRSAVGGSSFRRWLHTHARE